jgi:peptide/nickel transport system substrate-binding protein
MRLRTAIAALMVAAMPSLAAPAAAKDNLVIGVSQFPSSMHPDFDAEVVKNYVLGFTTHPITAYDPDWKLTCMLCSELPTIQNGLAKIEDTPSGKGMAVTLKLRPDLAWGDGVPVTTKDLVFTWKVGHDPASGFINPHTWDQIRAIDVVDDHTAVLHFAKVTVHYNELDTLLPEHIEAPILAKAGNPAEYIKETAYNRAPTTAGLYDGPFVVIAYQSGVQVVLEPNPHWPGTKPYFKRIVIKLIGNTAALQANLLSGDVDMVAGEGVGLSIDQVIALRKQQPNRFTYIFKPSLNYEHIDLKIENPILADIRVRRALLLALDRKTLVDKLFEGMQPVATTWVNPLDPNFASDIPAVPYEPAQARALLAEAGWKPGADGICRNAKGERLSLEFQTTSGNQLRELTQQVLKDQWKGVGVEAVIKNEPPRTLFGETVKQREFTGMVMYAWTSGVNNSPRQTLHSSQIPTAANNWGGSNYIAMNDKRMDTLIDQADAELDPVKQKAIWEEMQHIYVDAGTVLPLFYRAEAHVVPKWLKGYTPTGHGDMSILWAENWRAE